eukprot:577762_1
MTHSMPNESVHNAFKHAPFELVNPVKLADTLQGSIWRATTSPSCTVVLKLTNREHHMNSTATCNNTLYHNIKENIVLEQSILKYVTQDTDCPQSIAKFVAFFQTDDLFVLIQEDGGYPLFNFVTTAHHLIRTGQIDIDHWKKVVKVIFIQMIDCLGFIHSKGVTHHDISLENFVLNDVNVQVNEEDGTMKFIVDEIRIKLCDFGLAEYHNTSQCLSVKHCGKKQYYSPEVMNLKERFNAKRNDIWGIGVCLFVLLFGCPPWRAARVNDDAYNCIMNGHILKLLEAWNLSTYVDTYIIDLFHSIFKGEEQRMNLFEMKQHRYVC